MFPSGNSNGNPILQCSIPSFHSSNSSFLGLNGNQILLHQRQDQVSTHYLAANNGYLIDNSSSVMMFANNVIHNRSTNQEIGCPLNKMMKKPVKKDRHSKILTSQGHRDRRVRLSIGVARKFFDLQDMLRFDKPSKTLDWLFTKSKLAIEALTTGQMKTTSPNEPKKIPSCINSEYEDVVIARAKQEEEAIVHLVARESRAKARARARERTIRKVWSQIEAKINSSSVVVKEQTKIDEIKEMIHGSVLVDRKNIKSSSSTLGFHHLNLSGTEEAAANSNYNSSSSGTQNWDHDVNRTITNSSLSAVMATISTSSQVVQGCDQNGWDSYHCKQI